MWPANSPDLNPVDYSIWGSFQTKVYTGFQIDNLQDIQERIINVWTNFPQQQINACIQQWRPRLQAVVDNNGGHIEHMFQ